MLDPASPTVLHAAKAQAEESFGRYDQSVRRRQPAIPWGYEISAQRSLLFRQVQVRGVAVQPDLFCRVVWLDPDDLPIDLNVVVRVWAMDPAVIFRPNLDADAVRASVDSSGRRVMLRYHFDLANPGQPGPRFHIQAGGNAPPEELCWLHEAVAVPRIAHHPMDVMLACEMIAANFYDEEGRRALDDTTVAGALRESQRSLLLGYYEGCLAALNSGTSLLMSLWAR
ncbi:MAG: hypothetical protein L0227_01945 [Chloroflexi bacterium]|nr:hypothetical protein [Chloroflexota bacterium]